VLDSERSCADIVADAAGLDTTETRTLLATCRLGQDLALWPADAAFGVAGAAS
jgi:hypothetical protein